MIVTPSRSIGSPKTRPTVRASRDLARSSSTFICHLFNRLMETAGEGWHPVFSSCQATLPGIGMTVLVHYGQNEYFLEPMIEDDGHGMCACILERNPSNGRPVSRPDRSSS